TLPPVLVDQSLTVASLDERAGWTGRSSQTTLRLPGLDARHPQRARCRRNRDRRFENLSSIHPFPPGGVSGPASTMPWIPAITREVMKRGSSTRAAGCPARQGISDRRQGDCENVGRRRYCRLRATSDEVDAWRRRDGRTPARVRLVDDRARPAG